MIILLNDCGLVLGNFENQKHYRSHIHILSVIDVYISFCLIKF